MTIENAMNTAAAKGGGMATQSLYLMEDPRVTPSRWWNKMKKMMRS